MDAVHVFAEYHGLCAIVNIFPFENFIDLMQRVFHRDVVFAGAEKRGREPFLDELALI